MPPLGYDVVQGGGKLAVNEDEAEQVRAIFQLYAEEKSLLHVVELLNARGSRTKSWVRRDGQRRNGVRWDKSSLRKLLTNVVYLGKVAHRGEVLPGEQPGIVDADLFARVGELLRGGQRNWQRSGNKHGFVLRGLVRCTACGSAMTSVVSAPRGKPYRYYSCTGPRRQGTSVCPVRNVSASELERFVVERIKGIGQDTELLHATLAAITEQRESQKPALEGEQRRLQVEREQCRRDAKGLVAALAAQTGDGRSITERLGELDERTGQIDARLAELDAALAAIARAALGSNDVATALAQFDPVWEALRAREQAELLQLLIERVDYDGVGGGVTICFRGAAPGRGSAGGSVSGAAAVRYAFSARRDGDARCCGEGPALAPVPSGRVPRISRLLALAHRFQGMLDRGEVASMAEHRAAGAGHAGAGHAGDGLAAPGAGHPGGVALSAGDGERARRHHAAGDAGGVRGGRMEGAERAVEGHCAEARVSLAVDDRHLYDFILLRQRAHRAAPLLERTG